APLSLSARAGKIFFATLGRRPHLIQAGIFRRPGELAPSARDQAAGPPCQQKDLTYARGRRAPTGALNRRPKVSRTVPGHAKTPGRPRPSSRATVPAPQKIPRGKDPERVLRVRDWLFFSSAVICRLSLRSFSFSVLLPPAP